DETMKNIVQQEEEIFERTYTYAHLNIQYASEYDVIDAFLKDSIRTIMINRALTNEEREYFTQQKANPRQIIFATGAIAFIKNLKAMDTTYVYEDLMSRFKDDSGATVFVLENAKSGISQELLNLLKLEKLPKHFYALNTKQEVMEYVESHDNAIGIVDYSDFSDSDSAFTKDVLSKIHLLGVTRPADSTQFGFVKPYQYNLQDRKYPFTRDLYFISKTGREDAGIGFASFICGEIGQKIILKAGLLPKFQSERTIELNYTNDIKVVK
ncbi:MAG TPA: substrate-binding domain-containing protein, partial [Saprospiraceae bacterium]|nr:substrate-binding domain-containing protein [Saprospiraceae bacterium]